jgi:hypothetical protein
LKLRPELAVQICSTIIARSSLQILGGNDYASEGKN